MTDVWRLTGINTSDTVLALETEAKGRRVIGNPVRCIHQEASPELYPQLYMVDVYPYATGDIINDD